MKSDDLENYARYYYRDRFDHWLESIFYFMKLHPIRKLRPAPTLTSGQKYAREAFACILIGLAIGCLLWWGLPQ